MNLQEIFDKVTEHLYKQGGPAKEQSSCQYLASDGKKCAVGCLIKSEFYDESLENHLIGDKIVLDAVNKSLGLNLKMDGMEVDLLERLQFVHDNADRLDPWATHLNVQLGRVATRFGLNFQARNYYGL